MKRALLALLVCAVTTAGPASAETQVYYGFHIGITNAPPAPTIVYREAPDVVIVPGTQVYVVERGDNDCDFFRYGKYWYVTSGGFWYRAGSYRGPFRVVDVRYVPRSILAVPAKHWKHHPHGGPPGHAKSNVSQANVKKQSSGKGKKGKGH